MFSLIRLILIDSYKPGTLQEVRLDGPTNLNGVNGAGKTTLLRLIPLFFGESPNRLVPKSRVNESFVQHYLPHDSSYIIFEYRRPRQTCLAVMYASPNEGSLCYRFIDKAFNLEDFLVADADGGQMPVSCRDLARHVGKRGGYCSSQLSARNDFRTIIQNLPHAKGTEMRQLIARFSFCESVSGRRLQHMEKIVTGMFMRSTDFRDLREMLVSCIEEDRESITLELKTDTLDDWCKEYRAFLHADAQRDRMAELEQIDASANVVRQELAELATRVRRSVSRAEDEHRESEAALRGQEQRLSELKAEWEARERDLKRGQAETEARLAAERQQLRQLVVERDDWEKQDMQRLQLLYDGRETTRGELDQARQNQRRLLEKVGDIDTEFKRLRAEKDGEFERQGHDLETRIQRVALEAEQEKNKLRDDFADRERVIREAADLKHQASNRTILQLRETRGQLTNQLKDIQADPELLHSREAKRAALDEAHLAQEVAADQLEKQDAKIRQQQAGLVDLEQRRRQLAEQRRRFDAEQAELQRHLEADSASLLGFLREHHADWTQHIAKLIRPELLLRDDLAPHLLGTAESFYGLGLSLDVLSADRSASEAALRAALAQCRAESERLLGEEGKLGEQFTAFQKTSQALDKERRQLDLALGQCRTRIKQLKDEAASLERQIEASLRERRQSADARLQELQGQLTTAESDLALQQTGLKESLGKLREDLAARLADIAKAGEEQAQQLRAEIDRMRLRQQHALSALEAQRLASLAQGGVDTLVLASLESDIQDLTERLRQADQAADAVEAYRRWLKNEWPRHERLAAAIKMLADQLQEEQALYGAASVESRQHQDALKSQIAEREKQLTKLAAMLNTLLQMQQELERYPRLPEASVVLDAAHTVGFLQARKHELLGQERELQKQLNERVALLKRALDQFPGTQPARFREAIVQDIGLDAPERAWLPHLRDWYAQRADEVRRVLVMQANTFGSAVRNYHQALARFDRGIDSLSRRLAASIDRNIGFDKIEAIHARLLSNVGELGYWQQIVDFTDLYDNWQRSEDPLLPSREFADAVQLIASQLQTPGKVETRLVNLLGLEIAVTENGKVKRATHDEELRQISSHGLSYLILCVFFVALVNMIRKEQAVAIIWPMDELKDLHQMNIERLLTILNQNNITLLSAFPDPDPEVLKSFKNRYEIYGYRELLEMVIDMDDNSLADDTTAGEAPAHV